MWDRRFDSSFNVQETDNKNSTGAASGTRCKLMEQKIRGGGMEGMKRMEKEKQGLKH